MTETVLVTGSAGEIGRHLRATLRRDGRRLVLFDVAEQAPLEPGEDAEIVTASFTDPAAIAGACAGVDAVIHLGGLSTYGYDFADYLAVNVEGTRQVLEAAHRRGVARVIYASSHHAVGFHPNTPGSVVPDDLAARPDSYYGVSKVAGEALASLYHDRYGLDVISVRIGSYRSVPSDRRTLWNWLSPGDCTRLFEATLATPSPGYRVVWGVSANTARIAALEGSLAIGYRPLDDAADFTDRVSADPEPWDRIGGLYSEPTIDDAPTRRAGPSTSP